MVVAQQLQTSGVDLVVAPQPQTPGSDFVVLQQPTSEGNVVVGFQVPHQLETLVDNVIGAQPLSTPGYQSLDQSNLVNISGHPRSQLGQLFSMFIIAVG